MNEKMCGNDSLCVRDFGGRPLVIDLDCITECNPNYRTALWTGDYLQVTLMCIPVGGDIGAEVHCDTDQFLRIESGCGMAVMGSCKNKMTCRRKVDAGDAVIIPAGTWHNLINTGNIPLKIYSVYAPPHHPFGTVQRTKKEAQQAEC